MIIWFVHNDFTFTRFIELKIIDLYGSGLLIVLYEQLKYQKFALNTGSRGIIIITKKSKKNKEKKNRSSNIKKIFKPTGTYRCRQYRLLVTRPTNMEKGLTDLEKKQQGPVIYLLRPEKIRSTWRNVQVADLNKDGLDLLINKMTKLYVEDSKAAAHITSEKSELFKHPAKMSIVDYLNEFEKFITILKDMK